MLVRHGESRWNVEGRWAGWADVELSPRGIEQARAAGMALRTAGLHLAVAHTSLLQRTVHTAEVIAAELAVPPRTLATWRLNERHPGALEGLTRDAAIAAYGRPWVRAVKRRFDTVPPLLGVDDPRHPRHDCRYRSVPQARLPAGESLHDAVGRLLPHWHANVLPDLRRGYGVLVVTHQHLLRALRCVLEGFSEQRAALERIDGAQPRVLWLDPTGRAVRARDVPIPIPVSG